MNNTIVVYFACSDSMLTKAKDRVPNEPPTADGPLFEAAGSPQQFFLPDGYTHWIRVLPYEEFVFWPTRRDALDHAIDCKYRYVFEAQVTVGTCARALTAALESETQELGFAIKELLQLQRINQEEVKG
jgi:hypothetical protein